MATPSCRSPDHRAHAAPSRRASFPRVVVMVKEPVAGRVKTRLARGIGAVQACRFYRTATANLIARLAADPRWQLVLAVSPDIAGSHHRLRYSRCLAASHRRRARPARQGRYRHRTRLRRRLLADRCAPHAAHSAALRRRALVFPAYARGYPRQSRRPHRFRSRHAGRRRRARRSRAPWRTPRAAYPWCRGRPRTKVMLASRHYCTRMFVLLLEAMIIAVATVRRRNVLAKR